MRRAVAALASVGLAACTPTPDAQLEISSPNVKETPEDVTLPAETTTAEPTTTTEPPTTVTSSPPQRPSTTVTLPPNSVARSTLPVDLGDVWWRLAMCEDGGRNRWFPPYSGYFHFLPSTYQAYGGVGYPHEHDYETQLAVAQRLQAAEGWYPWPGCAAKLGLLP